MLRKKYAVGLPLERVGLDILGPLPESSLGNKYILVVSDCFTKWVEAYPILNQETVTIANVLVNEFISRFQVPLLLHSDQGSQFESSLFQELCSLLDIDKTRITAYHPQSDGLPCWYISSYTVVTPNTLNPSSFPDIVHITLVEVNLMAYFLRFPTLVQFSRLENILDSVLRMTHL